MERYICLHGHFHDCEEQRAEEADRGRLLVDRALQPGDHARERTAAMVGSAPGGRAVPANRYIVFGRVQGVGYRYFVLREAEGLGVSGFARNRPDGSVEVVAEGPEETLAELEGRLREGPAFSTVTGVEREAIVPRGDNGFHIR